MKKIKMILGIIGIAVLLAGCEKSVEQQIAEQMDLGQKYLAEGNYKEAIITFNKVIEINSQMISAYSGLAEAYEAQGDYGNALNAQDKVLKLSESTSEVFRKAWMEYTRLLALTGNIAGSLERLGSLNMEKIHEEEKVVINDLTGKIIGMCFKETFIRPEEMTVNRKPFWEASFEDAVAAYPCDWEEDVSFDGEIYNVYHRSPTDPSQRAGKTKFIQKNDVIYAAFFCDAVTHRGSIDGKMNKNYIPQSDQPEIRGVKIGDTLETVMDKIGIAEAGQKFLLGNLNKAFEYRGDTWNLKEQDYSWVTEISTVQGLDFIWKNEDKSVRLTLIFDSDGILYRLDYHLDFM